MKKRKVIPDEIIRLFSQLRRITSIYLDTCIIGYLTDGSKHKEEGDLIDRYIKKYKIKPIISELVLEELNQIQIPIKNHRLEKISDLWATALNKIKPSLLKIKKVSKEEKDFVRFLRRLKIKKNDAIHFTITTFHNIDAFLSFNKRLFTKNIKKISERLLLVKKRMPEILEAEELCKALRKLEKHNFI